MLTWVGLVDQSRFLMKVGFQTEADECRHRATSILPDVGDVAMSVLIACAPTLISARSLPEIGHS